MDGRLIVYSYQAIHIRNNSNCLLIYLAWDFKGWLKESFIEFVFFFLILNHENDTPLILMLSMDQSECNISVKLSVSSLFIKSRWWSTRKPLLL